MKYCPVCGDVMEEGATTCHSCEIDVLTSFKSYLAKLEPEQIDVLSKAIGSIDLTPFLLSATDVLDFAEAMKPAEFFQELRRALKSHYTLEYVLSSWKCAYSEEIAEWLK